MTTKKIKGYSPKEYASLKAATEGCARRLSYEIKADEMVGSEPTPQRSLSQEDKLSIKQPQKIMNTNKDKHDVILEFHSSPDAILNALHQAGWAVVPKQYKAHAEAKPKSDIERLVEIGELIRSRDQLVETLKAVRAILSQPLSYYEGSEIVRDYEHAFKILVGDCTSARGIINSAFSSLKERELSDEQTYPDQDTQVLPESDLAKLVTYEEYESVKAHAEALAEALAMHADLVAVGREIANDSKCDLRFSERRIRLYSALDKLSAFTPTEYKENPALAAWKAREK